VSKTAQAYHDIGASGRVLTAMGMMRDCQVVSSREGTREVMSGLTRLLSSQYQDVRSTASLLLCPVSPPPQIADVACASVPAAKHCQSNGFQRQGSPQTPQFSTLKTGAVHTVPGCLLSRQLAAPPSVVSRRKLLKLPAPVYLRAGHHHISASDL